MSCGDKEIAKIAGRGLRSSAVFAGEEVGVNSLQGHPGAPGSLLREEQRLVLLHLGPVQRQPLRPWLLCPGCASVSQGGARFVLWLLEWTSSDWMAKNYRHLLSLGSGGPSPTSARWQGLSPPASGGSWPSLACGHITPTSASVVLGPVF